MEEERTGTRAVRRPTPVTHPTEMPCLAMV